MKRLFTLLFAAVIISSSASEASDYDNDQLACHLRILTNVAISIQAKDKDIEEYLWSIKEDLRQLIRLRFRNDLSMLSHEDLGFSELYAKFGYDLSVKEIKERGYFTCKIWAVGDSYPIAHHVTCTLSGFGDFKNTIWEPYMSATLGYTDKNSLRGALGDSLRSIIEEIASRLLEKAESDCNNS